MGKYLLKGHCCPCSKDPLGKSVRGEKQEILLSCEIDCTQGEQVSRDSTTDAQNV